MTGAELLMVLVVAAVVFGIVLVASKTLTPSRTPERRTLFTVICIIAAVIVVGAILLLAR